MSEGALKGRRILVTRPRSEAAGLVAAIEASGGEAILFPTIDIDSSGSFPDFERTMREINNYDYIVATSANTARVVARALGPSSLAGEAPPAGGLPQADGLPRFVAIGKGTASALEAAGLPVDVMPEEAVSDRIAAVMGEVAGKRVLVPGSDLARALVGAELRAAGAIVDEVVAYRTILGEPDAAALAELRRGVDAVLFSSPSTARNFSRIVGGPAALGKALVACIGPVTAEAAEALGYRVDLVAKEHGSEGLLAALLEYWRGAETASAKE